MIRALMGFPVMEGTAWEDRTGWRSPFWVKSSVPNILIILIFQLVIFLNVLPCNSEK